ncbi:sigma factor-like helix-turn-helix DNA-binding protein [Kitasatospora sp. NPDC002543]
MATPPTADSPTPERHREPARTGTDAGHLLRKLTPREAQTLAHLAAGHDLPRTAAALGVTPTTARSYLQRALRKLGTRTEAQALALLAGVLPHPHAPGPTGPPANFAGLNPAALGPTAVEPPRAEAPSPATGTGPRPTEPVHASTVAFPAAVTPAAPGPVAEAGPPRAEAAPGGERPGKRRRARGRKAAPGTSDGARRAAGGARAQATRPVRDADGGPDRVAPAERSHRSADMPAAAARGAAPGRAPGGHTPGGPVGDVDVPGAPPAPPAADGERSRPSGAGHPAAVPAAPSRRDDTPGTGPARPESTPASNGRPSPDPGPAPGAPARSAAATESPGPHHDSAPPPGPGRTPEAPTGPGATGRQATARQATGVAQPSFGDGGATPPSPDERTHTPHRGPTAPTSGSAQPSSDEPSTQPPIGAAGTAPPPPNGGPKATSGTDDQAHTSHPEAAGRQPRAAGTPGPGLGAPPPGTGPDPDPGRTGDPADAPPPPPATPASGGAQPPAASPGRAALAAAAPSGADDDLDAEPPAVSFEELYETAHTRLVQQVFLLTACRHRAVHCVRRAFGEARRRWGAVAASGSPEGWVRVRACELALSPWHRGGPRRTHAWGLPHRRIKVRPADEAQAVLPDHDRLTDRDRALLKALKRLSRPQRRALVLHDGLGLPAAEIAVEVESTLRAAERRVWAARAALALWVPELVGPDPAAPGFADGLSVLLHRAAVRGCPEPHRTPVPVLRARHRLWTASRTGAAALLTVAVGGATLATLAGVRPAVLFRPAAPPRPVLCLPAAAPPEAAQDAETPEDAGPGVPLRPGAAPNAVVSLWCSPAPGLAAVLVEPGPQAAARWELPAAARGAAPPPQGPVVCPLWSPLPCTTGPRGR